MSVLRSRWIVSAGFCAVFAASGCGGKLPTADELKQHIESAGTEPAKTDPGANSAPADPAAPGGTAPPAVQATDGSTPPKTDGAQGTAATPAPPVAAPPEKKPVREPAAVIAEMSEANNFNRGFNEGTLQAWVEELVPNAKQVTELHFEGLGMLGISPNAFTCLAKLPHLQKLSFMAGNISPATLKELAFLPELKELHFGHRTYVPEHFEEMSKLPVVETIGLSSSTGITADIQKLAKIPSLQALDLSRTEASDSWIPALASLRGLKRLSLAGTTLSDKGLYELRAFPVLEDLNLDGCKGFDGSGLAWVKSGKGLRVLNVSNSGFSGPGYGAIMGSPGLVEFHGSRTGCTDEFLQAFKGCGNLRVLALPANSQISGAGFRVLAVKGLEHLNLEGCPIPDANLALIQKFKSLKTLNLKGTGVSSGGAQALQRLLPKCTIIR